MPDENGDIIYDSTNKYTPSNKDYQVLGHNAPEWTMGFPKYIHLQEL